MKYTVFKIEFQVFFCLPIAAFVFAKSLMSDALTGLLNFVIRYSLFNYSIIEFTKDIMFTSFHSVIPKLPNENLTPIQDFANFIILIAFSNDIVFVSHYLPLLWSLR